MIWCVSELCRCSVGLLGYIVRFASLFGSFSLCYLQLSHWVLLGGFCYVGQCGGQACGGRFLKFILLF